MSGSNFRILLVEDDFLIASVLAADIRGGGNEVVGPFATVDDALLQTDQADAAILDIKLRDATSFPVAESLLRSEKPFVFLTGYEGDSIPERMRGHEVFHKPSPIQPIVHLLHERHQRRAALQAESLETIVLDMIQRSRLVMPNAGSAERLVEATLLRAIDAVRAGEVSADTGRSRDWLLHLLQDECGRHALRLLN